MLVFQILVLLACSIVYSKCSFVEHIPKCSINDQDCQKNLFYFVLRKNASTGISELNVPPVDPAKLKTVTISIFNFINVTIEDGIIKGIKQCTINGFKSDFEKKETEFNVTCDLNIEGKYKIQASSPTIESLFGGKYIHGDGNGKIEIDKIHFLFKLPFHFVKRADGELHMQIKLDHDCKIHGHVKFYADLLYVGDKEASDKIVNYLNENWKHFTSHFGMEFTKATMEIFYERFTKFFEGVPTKYLFIEDLTKYVKET